MCHFSSADAEEACQGFVHECGNLHRRMTNICEIPPTHHSINIDDYSPNVCIDFVPERFRGFLPSLATRQNSAVFRDMLEKTARSKNIAPEDKWWDVLVSVWHEAETEWSNACNAMRSGNVTVQEAEKLFSVFDKKKKQWFAKCQQELQLMAAGGSSDWVEERMQQFQCLSRLSTQREAARTLCQIREEFGFTGDVGDIGTIQHVVSLNMSMESTHM